MRPIRLSFAWCFALAALASLWMAGMLLPPHGTAFSLRELLLAAPLALGVLFGMAWWTVLTRKANARKWAIAASVVPILVGLFTIVYMHPAGRIVPLWVAVAIGYASLAVFTRRDTTPAESRPPSHAALPGDGTSALGSKLAALGAAVGAIEGTSHWSNWAAAHSLPTSQSPTMYLQFLITVLLVLFIHEGGHALAGVLLRMKLIAFIVGPFRWWMVDDKWKFEFRPTDIVSFLGGTAVVPAETINFRRRKIVQVAAGPIASLVTGALAVFAILSAPGHAWAGEWRVIAYFTTISLVVAFLNLIPFKMGSGYSDGAKLYQLSKEGLWADYHRLLGVINSTKVTAHRPRDYDIATVERAAGTIAKGADELNMHLCAYAFYLDRGQLPQALQALAKAELLCQESSLEPPDHWYSEFVFAIAFLRRDSAAARRWWKRMEAKESFRFSDRLLDSRCALLLSENRLQEAAEVWKKADAWARQLPKAGAGDAQRHTIQLLGRALRESISSVAV
jgi:hypothetical protein